MTSPGFFARVRTLLRRRRLLDDYDAEVRNHLDLLATDLERQGLTAEAARREARRQFGGVDQARETYRDASGFPTLDELAGDVRYGLRMMRRQPGFSLIVVLLVAIGVGANTAIFSLVNAVLLRPLPYRAPERLAVVRVLIPAMARSYPSVPAAAGEFLLWQARVPAFESMAAVKPVTQTMTGAGDATRVEVARVTATLLPMLGVQPVVGRTFRTDEDQEGRGTVVLLTYGFWQDRFGGDRTVLGRSVVLDGKPFTIVGVLGSDFRFPRHEQLGALVALPEHLDLLRPAAFDADERATTVGDFDWAVLGRFAPGATEARATAELDAVQADIVRQIDQKVELKAQVVPLYEQVVGQSRRGLLLLGWSVAAVLLVLAVNLANLLLSRVSARAHEAAIRAALGASRLRVTRQLVIENLLLALAGGVLGVGLAWVALRTLASAGPAGLPRLDEVGLDGTVLAFALGTSLGTGLLFSALPAWRLGGTDPQSTLRAGARAMSEGAAPLRLRSALVTVEVALSTVLVASAVLLSASFVRLMHVDTGFSTDGIVFATISPSVTRYADDHARTALYDRLLARLRGIGGVTAATLVSDAPLQGEGHVRTISLEHDTRRLDQRPVFNVRYVDAGYFHALGITLTRGRLFADGDRARRVALLNERAAETLWPGQDPIGRRFRQGNDAQPFYELIGIVSDTREVSLYKAPYLMSYVPYWSEGAQPTATLVLKTSLDVKAVVPLVGRAVHDVDPEVPAPAITTFSEAVDQAVAPDRFQMLLVGGFALAALLLASLGIYGVPAFAVARRSRELGIRLALGAAPGHLVRTVVIQGLVPVTIGLGIGLAGAAVTGRLIQGLLFDAAGVDWRTLAGVALGIAVVALVACYIPARRVTRIDPVQAIRWE